MGIFENNASPPLPNGRRKKYFILAFSILFHIVIIAGLSSFPRKLKNDEPIRLTPSNNRISVFVDIASAPSAPPSKQTPKTRNNAPKGSEEKPTSAKPSQGESAVPTEPPKELKPEPASSGPPGNTLNPSKEKPTGAPNRIADGSSNITVTDWEPASGPEGPIRPGGSIPKPKLIKYIEPDYPKTATDARIEGTVIIDAIIGKDGKIRNVKIVQSVPMLDRAALEAVKQWQYTPTIVKGEPVEILLTVTVYFVLK
ncbi:MAG: hypothetical protein A2925_03655 [Candidatus Yanofskybacteria bacterium RIFCSPLOWO2_01_FULL_44_22]|uniref:TonB C-terminal domain-containing protein n=2 Tax=Candidatus Yanofskyibacteriota TaxID=1752733 RepID=A0A1F8GML2_9BACT|nr:MAG: TonB family protein [Candidatus Yanofskybacteria bacterium GW2011_GWA2_44_9]OGN04736.1 MAG: hypothetical protein A2659_01270 [Candidatus Yanofskybacteria bacterium RIFCSPHIGHO2_01_FULL_44_24]OGN26655.1 MAG: hypothetical protein A2925_03655 [Candidatus Yanofskybacteria bacterium RIFCSPLOWO2_01_FULL_44_22]